MEKFFFSFSDEEVLLKDRARLYRFGPDDHDQIPQWKERGTGDVKLLKDRLTGRKESFSKIRRKKKWENDFLKE